MANELADIKPFDYGYPQLHLVSPVTTTDPAQGPSDPDLLSFTKTQMKDYLLNKSSQNLEHTLITPGVKRTHKGLPKELQLSITDVRSVSYKHLLTQTPRKPRTTLTKETKEEIVDFHKKHPLLRQGEIADIFGIDRTTVTKLLKKSRHDTSGEEEDSWRSAKSYQYELEDILYRWIMRSYTGMEDWPDERLLKQAVELQEACDIGHLKFRPNMAWLQEFKRKFRLRFFGQGDDEGDDYMIKAEPAGSYNSEMNFVPIQPAPVQSEPLDLQKSVSVTLKAVSLHKIPKEMQVENPVIAAPDSESKPDPEPEQEIQELSSEQVLNREMQSLEKFREQQKAIEEANKQKKALLAKTLTERKKMAQREASKLEHIQKELSKLDHLLTADVQVIRGKIEEASREFLDAQKRFEKAEAEYVASKLELHDKSELKEQLTEHLYTIIHQNEVRKAKKLADLMKELEMEAGEENLQLPELPPLTSFQQSTITLSPTGSKAPLSQSQQSPTHPSIQSDNNQTVSPGINKTDCPSTSDPGSSKTGDSTETSLDVKCEASNQVTLASDTVTSDASSNIPQPADVVHDDSELSKVSREKLKNHSADAEMTVEPSTNTSSDVNGNSDLSSSSVPEPSKTKTKTAWDFEGSLT